MKIPVSVLVVIYTVRNEVLLLERADHPGYWQSVTGSLDHRDEPLIEAARREVMEETGIEAGDNLVSMNHSIFYEIYPHWRHRYAPGVTTNQEHWFLLKLPHKVEVKLSPREHLAHQWLSIEDAAKACFSPSNREAILRIMV